jgi:hypothetical protein
MALPLQGSKLARLGAMLLIGDGIYAIVHPHREPDAWWVGPKAWKRLLGEISERPALARGLGALQVGLAMYWLVRTGNEEDRKIARQQGHPTLFEM